MRLLAPAILFVSLLLAGGRPIRADSTLGSTGNLPLPDLGSGLYLGEPGGLYPGGTSVRPAEHLQAGLEAASRVVPRDGAGNPDPEDGRMVLLSVGMSNTQMEFLGPDWRGEAFLIRALGLPQRNPRLAVVNGAQGGMTAPNWADPTHGLWSIVDARIGAAGATPAQVQVVWMKLAEAGPSFLGAFPRHVRILQADLERVARNLRARFPNLAILYVSSRTRAWTAGAAGDGRAPGLNPEPYAYESGFAVRWMIEDQMAGRGDLEFDASRGPVVAPWITWGPYLWADGDVPRSDGLTWRFADVDAQDYTHPSASGARKVADQLLAFFQADATAGWFLAPAAAPPAIDVSADVLAGVAPLAVRFSATPGASTYAWSFDDGTTSLAREPAKTFRVPGTYEVRMTASDASGAHVTRTLRVRVLDPFRPADRVRLAVGLRHSLGIGPDGAVLAGGSDEYGQLGSPVGPATAVAAGGFHSVALLADGTLVAWGANGAGQLGIGTRSRSSSPAPVAWSADDVVGVSAGWGHTLAWRADGSLWAWGDDRAGQLGDGGAAPRSSPIAVGLPIPIVGAAGGGLHSLAVGADGSIWAWGSNADGQLGDGSRENRLRPIQVPGLPPVVRVACGAHHSLALDSAGDVWTWGMGRTTPERVPEISGAIGVAAGCDVSAALLAGGTVRLFGRNSSALPSIEGVVELAAGARTFLALRSDGEILAGVADFRSTWTPGDLVASR